MSLSPMFSSFYIETDDRNNKNTPGQLNREVLNLSTYLLARGLTDHERLLERTYILPSTPLMILRLVLTSLIHRHNGRHRNIQPAFLVNIIV